MAKRRAWQDEFDVAALVLKDEPGKLEWAKDDYVAFRYKEPNVTIVFYPHKTSAGNHHLRTRDEGSKDKTRLKELQARLYHGSGFSCTFSSKYAHIYSTSPDGKEPGWAAKEAIDRAWI